jgi:hypothetical protein
MVTEVGKAAAKDKQAGTDWNQERDRRPCTDAGHPQCRRTDQSQISVPAACRELPGIFQIDGAIRIVQIEEVRKRDERTY